MTCDCSLKDQNGGVCNCGLSREDALDILELNDVDEPKEHDEPEVKDKDRFTKSKDDWFVQ